MARMVKCVKLGREAEGLEFPPCPGPLGKRLYDRGLRAAHAPLTHRGSRGRAAAPP